MRKIYLFVLFFCTYSIVFGQQRIANSQNPVSFKNKHLYANKTSSVIDTLQPPSFTDTCFTNSSQPLTLYTLGGTDGYVFGNNTYGDKEKAEKYNYTGMGTLTGVLIKAGYVKKG